MSYILAIETSTKNCSVALFKENQLVSFKEFFSERYSHSEQLTILIKNLILKSNITFKQISAVAISKGPGSFTGLRIGTATAKGLCYALEIPLISVSTLKAMAYNMASLVKYDLYCPMIDARRMEVYAGIYDIHNNEKRRVSAEIVTNETYHMYLERKILFFGDGASKCKEVITHSNAHFNIDFLPSAKNLGFLAYKRFVDEKFEDIAYFEPFYLKDFLINN